MTDYRMVTRHVRYWRGSVHRWSNVYPLTGTISAGNYAAAIAAMYAMEQKVCYTPTAVVDGGLYEIALYDHASGGVPIAVNTYFPYATPGAWIPYTATAWDSHAYLTIPAAEVALQVEWPAGLSRSGKPVTFKKWYHSVPQPLTGPGTVDVTAASNASLVTALMTGMAAIGGLGILLGNSSRLAATTPVVRSFYGNHQMPRGRRRKPLSLAGGSAERFPAGILIVPGSDGSLSG